MYTGNTERVGEVEGRCARCGGNTTERTGLGYTCSHCVAEALQHAIDGLSSRRPGLASRWNLIA